MKRTLFAAALTLAVAAIASGGCGSDNAIVGGDCASGYTNVGNECVLADASIATEGGADVLNADAKDVSNDTSDAAKNDGEAGPPGDGGDGGVGDGGDGGNGEGGVCVPPFNSPDYCGDCNTQCTGNTPICSPVDGGYACVPFCTPPLVNCGRQCVDTQTDGFNCGSCFHVCPTFICKAGQCSSGLNGDLVVIGHDYATTIPNSGSQQMVLTNSVFLRSRNPLRLLSYERYAANAAVNRVIGILQGHGGVQITHTNVDGDIPSMLSTANFDALLVFDQTQAPAGALGTLGASWATRLQSFTAAGGLVVVLNGGAGNTAEMPQFITGTGLLNVTAQTTLAQGTVVQKNAPGDAVATNVSTQYGVTRNSTRMATDPAAPPTLDYVFIEPASTQPTVIHKTF